MSPVSVRVLPSVCAVSREAWNGLYAPTAEGGLIIPKPLRATALWNDPATALTARRNKEDFSLAALVAPDR